MDRAEDPVAIIRSVPIEDGRHIQLLEPAAPNRSSYTIVMVPGGGLSSAIYLDNDRRGWAHHLAAAGYRVVLVDLPDETAVQRWTAPDAFSRWGIAPEGQADGTPSRFDAGNASKVQQLLRSPVAALSPEELGELLATYAPTVIIGHSFGGRTAIEAAGTRPDVKGLVLVEPLACPTDGAQLRSTFVETDRSLLSIWGDNLDRGTPPMLARRQACVTASQEITAVGGRACVLDLPAEGIVGNSHLMMAEDNASDIADYITRWLGRLEETPRPSDSCGRPPDQTRY